MPLSGDPVKRDRQLANLRPGAGHAVERNGRALRHGGYSAALLADVEGELLELMEALADAAPVKDADGMLPTADTMAVERAARALKRWRHLTRWLDLHGRLNERSGAVKPAAELELKAERELAAALDSLGMTPTSRAKLGLDLARTRRTLEDEAADGREAWKRAAIDGEATDAAA